MGGGPAIIVTVDQMPRPPKCAYTTSSKNISWVEFLDLLLLLVT
jgi:hypothetical protein